MTVDTFEAQRKCESSETMVVTRTATPSCMIPVIVDTFDRQTIYKTLKDDSYEDGDPAPRDASVAPGCSLKPSSLGEWWGFTSVGEDTCFGTPDVTGTPDAKKKPFSWIVHILTVSDNSSISK